MRTIQLTRLLLSGAALLGGCSPSAPPSAPARAVVMVPFDRPVAELKGHVWPRHAGNFASAGYEKMVSLRVPLALTIVFPDGSSLTSSARSVLLEQNNGVVGYASFFPYPAWELPSISEACKSVEAMFAQAGVPVEDKAREKLRAWLASPPAWRFGSTLLVHATLASGSVVEVGFVASTSEMPDKWEVDVNVHTATWFK